MSYILEALKKSEQERERERGTLPDIKSIHSPSTSSQREGRNWWPVVLVSVIVVSAAVGAGVYLIRIQPASTDVALVEQESNVSNAANIKPEPVDKPKPKAIEPNKIKKPAASAVEQKKSSVVFSKQQLQHDNVIGNVAEQRKQTAVEKKTSSTASNQGSVVKDAAIPIAEIPDSVRQQIPRIAFEGHVYSSTPTRRSVMINGHKMREGDAIGEDLMLKEITPEGAEFEYRGYRFKLNALQDWSFN